MGLAAILAIGIGGAVGALFRWWLGLSLNSIFPTIPAGTLTANLIGGFLMGIMIALTKNHSFIPEVMRLGITTGFLGGLTTFSTFSAETVALLSHQQYFWSSIIIIGHVGGSILATICGIYSIKLLTS